MRGFTLVELILVMVIIGALSAVGAARFFERGSYDAASYTEQLRSLTRFAQKVAIAQNRPVFVRLNGSGIALCFAGTVCDTVNRVRPPAGNNSGAKATVTACADARWACEGNPDGVSYTTSAPAFYFDQLGRPCAPTDAFGTVNSTFQKLTVSITGADGSTRAVLVEAETGYVH